MLESPTIIPPHPPLIHEQYASRTGKGDAGEEIGALDAHRLEAELVIVLGKRLRPGDARHVSLAEDDGAVRDAHFPRSVNGVSRQPASDTPSNMDVHVSAAAAVAIESTTSKVARNNIRTDESRSLTVAALSICSPDSRSAVRRVIRDRPAVSQFCVTEFTSTGPA